MQGDCNVLATIDSVPLRATCFLCIALSAAACGRAQPAAAPARPNVLLVTIDTFRADRVGTGVAPAIDRLAASGLRFTTARTTAPLTLPAHASIHTGLLPPAHGVRENGAQLAGTHLTLARMLGETGYDTAAFVGAFVLDRRFGLSQGFGTYDDQIPRDPAATERLEAERPAAAVVDRAITWLATRPAPGPQPPAPFFLWIHLYDPHAPYEAPAEYRARAATPYDGEIAYADAQLARLLDRLRAQGQFDRTLVVVAGDHGEGLGDHDERTHGMLVYDSTLRVPLVVDAPGVAAATRDEAVSLADLAPTILRAAGVSPPDAMRGRDLIGATVRLKADTTSSVSGDGDGRSVRLQPDRADDLYSETEYPRAAGWSPLQALTDGRWMAIRAGASTELYDLTSDPQQQRNVAGAHPAVAAAMAARAASIHATAAAAASPVVSPDAQERLRALGYVASSAAPAPAKDAKNPAGTISAWNEFEDALAALGAHRPDAAARLEALAAAHPDAPVFQATYARALKERGQLTAALAVYRRTLRRWPADATLLHDLAVAARDAANLAHGAEGRALREEAMRAEQAALALDSTSATAQNGLGLLAIDNGRAADAAKAFERAVALDANNASYWTNLGNARRALGDRTGAEHAYRKALEVDARAADAANGLGVLLVEANQPGDAAAWFERAIAAAPDLVEARLNLGIALQQSGQTARAEAAYRQVLTAPARYTRERDAATKLLASLEGAR
jgi:choline-sulfatase